MRFLTIALCFLFLQFSFAYSAHEPLSDYVTIPEDNATFYSLSESKNTGLIDFRHIKILTWNIYKQKHKEIYEDLNVLLEQVDFAFLQEAYVDTDFLLFIN